jgi:hypothetical protein
MPYMMPSTLASPVTDWAWLPPMVSAAISDAAPVPRSTVNSVHRAVEVVHAAGRPVHSRHRADLGQRAGAGVDGDEHARDDLGSGLMR